MFTCEFCKQPKSKDCDAMASDTVEQFIQEITAGRKLLLVPPVVPGTQYCRDCVLNIEGLLRKQINSRLFR